MSAPSQRSFAGGELAPALYARTDQTKYATGARVVRNFIVQRHGGVANRPGTVFVAAAKNSAVAVRLMKFVLDATDIADTYLLEVGAGYIRFFQDASAVIVSGVTAWADATAYAVGDLRTNAGVTYYCTAAHTSAIGTNRPGVDASWPSVWYALAGTTYEIPTPYQAADLAALQIVQSGDVITIVHPGYAPRTLSRYAHTKWILAPIVFGPSIAAPTNIAATGAGAAGTVYYAVTAVKQGTLEESLAGLYTFNKVPTAANPNTLTWNPVAGAISYNLYRSTDGTTFGLLSSPGGLPGTASDTSWADTNEVAVGLDPATWTPSAGQLRNALSVSATARAFDGKYTVKYAATLTGQPGSVGAGVGRVKIYYSRGGEPRVLATTTDLIIIDGEGTVGPTAMATVIDVPDNGYTALTIDVVPEALAAPGAGSEADLEVDSSTAPSNAVTWTGNVAGSIDGGDAPDYSIAPPVHPSVFATSGQYPGAITYFQQRLILGNSDTEPETVRASRIGSFTNFGTSTPLQADDAVTFTMAGRRVNAIKHLIDLGRLIVFGSGSEQLVNGDDAGILRPDAVNPQKVSANGSGALSPIELDDSALYVQGRGTIVRDLKPLGLDGYIGTDLTVFAAHLFAGYTLVDWDYALAPNSIVWAVRSDGTLLGLTYLRDQAVWGWHRHDTDGVIENVCTVPERDEDAVYLLVRRTISGATVRYIERLQSRYVADIADAIFADAAAVIDGRHTGTATMTLSGGTAWDDTERLVLTASAAAFTAGDVGNAIHLYDAAGALVRCAVESYASSTVVGVRADRSVPTTMRARAIGNGSGSWGRAVIAVSGLDHLEGKSVSVLADGFVQASPNNAAYPTAIVTAGAIALSSPAVRITVGLPYLSDLETLDLDSPGPRTIKDKKMLVAKVGLFVEASRGIWIGRPDKPTTALPLRGLEELKPRTSENYDDPPALQTDYVEVTIDGSWTTNGRVLVRQVDPLPLTVLAASPIGYIGG